MNLAVKIATGVAALGFAYAVVRPAPLFTRSKEATRG
jgi:hypothetical protein